MTDLLQIAIEKGKLGDDVLREWFNSLTYDEQVQLSAQLKGKLDELLPTLRIIMERIRVMVDTMILPYMALAEYFPD